MRGRVRPGDLEVASASQGLTNNELAAVFSKRKVETAADHVGARQAELNCASVLADATEVDARSRAQRAKQLAEPPRNGHTVEGHEYHAGVVGRKGGFGARGSR